jgi:Uma2 family endonuclease
VTTVTVMTHDAPWTIHDLDNLPDDGLRYELFDGELQVSASPSIPHQRTVFACARLLHEHCPAELEAFVAPLDFQPNERNSFEPDVLVARRDGLGVKNLTVAPVLAVEVLSPSTQSKDLIRKRELYQRFGVASYWVLDPDAVSLVAYDLVDGTYRRVVVAQGDEVVTLERPFTVRVCPADLVAGK